MVDDLPDEIEDAYFDEMEEDLKRIMDSEDDPEAEEVLRERQLEKQAKLAMDADWAMLQLQFWRSIGMQMRI